jgi:hypothetical protein
VPSVGASSSVAVVAPNVVKSKPSPPPSPSLVATRRPDTVLLQHAPLSLVNNHSVAPHHTTATTTTTTHTSTLTPTPPSTLPPSHTQHSISPAPTTVSSTSSSTGEWKVGDVIDAQDFQGQWFQGEVRRVRHTPLPPTRGMYATTAAGGGHTTVYLVQFEGYAPKWNEWVRHEKTITVGTRSEASSTRYMSYEDDHHSHAHVHDDQYEKMKRWIESSPNREIGGDLFGRWDTNGQPIIEYVLGPGMVHFIMLFIASLTNINMFVSDLTSNRS